MDTPITAQDRLTEHRLAALEAVAAGARQIERDTDQLKLTAAHIEQQLAEFKSEARERDDRMAQSLARLHELLAGIVTDDARDQGARLERGRMLRALAVSVPASAAVASTIVALLALVT